MRASQVAPARVTSPRNAGRFKGFRALGRGRMRGSHLNLGAHVWGLILRKWPSLAALSEVIAGIQHIDPLKNCAAETKKRLVGKSADCTSVFKEKDRLHSEKICV